MTLNHFWFEGDSSFISWVIWIVLFSMLHLAIIAPILFKFWIIPKISKRYNIVFEANYSPPLPPSSKWGVPPVEISMYIVAKYMGWEKFIYLGFYKSNSKLGIRPTVQKINYDIKTASRAEIILSFITFFCTIFCLFAIIFMGFPLVIRKLLA